MVDNHQYYHIGQNAKGDGQGKALLGTGGHQSMSNNIKYCLKYCNSVHYHPYRSLTMSILCLHICLVIRVNLILPYSSHHQLIKCYLLALVAIKIPIIISAMCKIRIRMDRSMKFWSIVPNRIQWNELGFESSKSEQYYGPFIITISWADLECCFTKWLF